MVRIGQNASRRSGRKSTLRHRSEFAINSAASAHNGQLVDLMGNVEIEPGRNADRRSERRSTVRMQRGGADADQRSGCRGGNAPSGQHACQWSVRMQIVGQNTNRRVALQIEGQNGNQWSECKTPVRIHLGGQGDGQGSARVLAHRAIHPAYYK